ncbi:hypothetical protein NC796_10825 [Aliifodinibius sp. S!AR15-10]|uniref:hypothetical protein n=1 Tax=Aliifodinibius sp. S!AR15-10 TaxID=2950437 RepID=UPI00285D652D|nr:hypothetical protein [Aliifodinibius sp. S!AR15-10]MDR8391637.1 hypothetical protein [Aliifodinibius sp. S!AR15-10]
MKKETVLNIRFCVFYSRPLKFLLRKVPEAEALKKPFVSEIRAFQRSVSDHWRIEFKWF